MLVSLLLLLAAAQMPWLWPKTSNAAQPFLLDAESFRHHVDRFNKDDEELYVNAVPNAAAWEFLKYIAGVPGQRLIARLGRSTPGRKSVAYSKYFNRPDTPYNERRMVDAIDFVHLQPITPDPYIVQNLFCILHPFASPQISGKVVTVPLHASGYIHAVSPPLERFQEV